MQAPVAVRCFTNCYTLPLPFYLYLIAYGLGAVLQAKCMGIKNGRFLTNISLYLGNDRIYGDSYNGRQIGTPICDLSNMMHFLYFNVTILLFNVKYSKMLQDRATLALAEQYSVVLSLL